MRTSKCAVLCESRIRIAYCVWKQRNISSTSARISGPKLDTYCCWMVRLATRWRKRKTCYWMKQQWFCATFYATTKFHINRARSEALSKWWGWVVVVVQEWVIWVQPPDRILFLRSVLVLAAWHPVCESLVCSCGVFPRSAASPAPIDRWSVARAAAATTRTKVVSGASEKGAAQ